MVPQWVIEKKRDGKPLAEDDIRTFIDGYATGSIPDYQMSALAMAIYFQGMAFDEVTVLTDAMMRSGDVLDTSSVPGYKVDKHSTGGIGDKVSLLLAPLAACCGVAVPMISGRGLGITGGTLDKLESIPGYRTDLRTTEFLDVLKDCGCSIIGQTEQLAPADRKLYALRDVTGTVPSIPLISASIMSKKLAEGADGLVLDVKWGAGAFMKTREQALELGRTMVEIGSRMGRGMTAQLTDMNQPLGRAAGNAVEVRETIDALKGQGPTDLMAVTLELCAHMLLLAGTHTNRTDALAALQDHLDSGRALERFQRMLTCHGGDPAIVDSPDRLPTASLQEPVAASTGGTVARADADTIGRACLLLGAGRQQVTDAIDPAVGITDLVAIGDVVEAGEPLAVLHANDRDKLDAARNILTDAFTVTPDPVTPPDLICDVIHPA
jgi:pyrimidine-nucleoside phosphorylase